MNQAFDNRAGSPASHASGLLPNLSANLRENVQQTNLAAFGFSLPGRPSVVGPFNYLTSAPPSVKRYLISPRYTITVRRRPTRMRQRCQPRMRGSCRICSVGRLPAGDRRSGADKSVQSQIDTAKAMFSQMQQQRSVGVVAPIDVNRSQVELQTQQQRLMSLQYDLAKQKINLRSESSGFPRPQISMSPMTSRLRPLPN